MKIATFAKPETVSRYLLTTGQLWQKKNKDIQKPERGIFRILELFTESIGWLQIVASPLLIGLVIGAIIYFSDRTILKLVIGIVVATVGLIIGIIWATKQWKGKGTIRFMSRIMATPELDNQDKESNEPKSISNDEQKGDN